MNLASNIKIILFAILEGEKAYTEINFFSGFIDSIKDQYKKISFIYPLAINGNIKNSKKFINNFFGKLEYKISPKNVKEKFDFLNNDVFDSIHIFCIWDTTKRKNNFEKNYNLLKKSKRNFPNIIYKCLVFEKGIEQGLVSKFFQKEPLSIKKLCQKMQYKSKDSFKLENNEHLFYSVIEKAKIDTNNNLLINMKKRLSNNDESNFVKILNLIEELND